MQQPTFRFLPAIFLLLNYNIAVGQLYDNFSDGDFLYNPAWQGTTAQYIVNSSFQLQLHSIGEGSSWLSTEAPDVGNTEWRFRIKLSFSPSENNNAIVYLASEQPDLSNKPDGLFLRFGEGGSQDAIRLFSRHSASDEEICTGQAGQIASGINLFIKVVRDLNGHFLLYTSNDGQVYILQGSGSNSYVPSASWFGWICKYTTSNATKFYLDDVYSGNPSIDITPPTLSSVTITDDQTLTLRFDESVDPLSAIIHTNYTLNPGNIYPQVAIHSALHPAEVTLSFADQFRQGILYTITANDVADIALNPCVDQSLEFCLYTVVPGDILISEIMADPDPPVGLPNFEYIELYNSTPIPIDLKGWKLLTGETERAIKGGILNAHDFIILCKAEASESLSVFGKTTSLSGLTLTNTGQSLRLLDTALQIIDSLTYSLSWYADGEKEDGGWSLELISPEDICLGKNNWHASVASAGGSPGAANSVVQYIAGAPIVDNAEIQDNQSIKIYFSQPMLSATITATENFVLSDGSSQSIAPATATPLHSDRVILGFSTPFADNVIYHLTIKKQVANCTGKSLSADTTILFGMPSPANKYDVLINEIMADPEPVVVLPSAEYIELYNRGTHPVNLQGWQLQSGSIIKELPSHLILPGEYLIVTAESHAGLFQQYGAVLSLESFSLANEGSVLVLYDVSGHQIHAVEYKDSWYGNSAKDEGGWSIEMIDPQNPCSGESNWISSCDVTGGTPGRQNSQYGSNPDLTLPVLLRAVFVPPDKVSLIFSETVDSIRAAGIINYTISPGNLHPLEAIPIKPFFDTVTLKFPKNLEPEQIYTIDVSDDLTDCTGNNLQSLSSVRVAVPEIAEVGNVVINELLSNPAGDGKDYLELYNSSASTINLATLGITYHSNSSPTVKTVFLPQGLLFPDGYALLSQKPDQLADRYSIQSPGNLIPFAKLPDFSSSGGIIVLHNKENSRLVIDSLVFDEDLHSPLLTSTDGVALERVNPLRPSSDRTNWQSAGATAGYGTPGYQNSQYCPFPSETGELICEPHIFSPDGDGHDDITSISLHLEEPGSMTTIAIFDATGRRIAVPVNNQLAGTSNVWSWNGITDKGSLSQSGIYIVLAEIVLPNGNTRKLKTTVVLTNR